jgi:hypothetical protein
MNLASGETNRMSGEALLRTMAHATTVKCDRRYTFTYMGDADIPDAQAKSINTVRLRKIGRPKASGPKPGAWA